MGGRERLADALRSLDLLVTIELYRNATGELADYVLPATDQLEGEDLNVFVQGSKDEPFVQWTPRVVAPEGEQRQEWEIFGQLIEAMGRDPLLPPGTADPMLLFDGALAGGVRIDDLRRAGGVVPLPEPAPGGSLDRRGLEGAIDIVPDGLRSTLDRGHELFRELAAEPEDGFKLITRKSRNTVNSWLHNLPATVADGEPNPCGCTLPTPSGSGSPRQTACASANRYGVIEAGVRFDRRLRAGVVAMTHGSATPRRPGCAWPRPCRGSTSMCSPPWARGPSTR